MLGLVLPAPASAAYVFQAKWGSYGVGPAQFDEPADIAVDGSGNVYVADTGNDRIQKFSSSGAFITQWGSHGSGSGNFDEPAGIAVDGSGNVYVADTGNDRIQKFSSSGAYITQWGSEGSGDGQFYWPEVIATDGFDNVYVAGTYFDPRIQKFSSSGAYITQWGSEGSGDGQFYEPGGVATDGSGNVYVADTWNNRIQKFTSSGSYLSQWGGFGSGNGEFFSPERVATDGSGNVYVADIGNDRIQKFTSSGGYLTQWGSYGTGDGQFKGGNTTPGREIGIAVDGSGNVYVADIGNDRIQKFVEVPPDTTIDLGPYGLTNDNTPTFTFSSNQGGSSFECRLDGGSFAPCAPPHITATLAEGPHTFDVRAVNGGTPDPSAASREFMVDTAAPGSQIISGPSGPTDDARPTFTFSSTDPTAAFTCSIDQGIPSFGACTTATSFQPASNLNDGSWTFRAKAADPAGNSTTATRSFTVDTNGPASGGPVPAGSAPANRSRCKKARRALANAKRKLRRANSLARKKKAMRKLKKAKKRVKKVC